MRTLFKNLNEFYDIKYSNLTNAIMMDNIKFIPLEKTIYNIKNNLIKLYTGENVKSGKRPESTILNSLTPREIEVLKLITDEYSSPEIADKLNISQSTVDTYRKSLLKKTNVKNSIGLAMYAVKNNII